MTIGGVPGVHGYKKGSIQGVEAIREFDALGPNVFPVMPNHHAHDARLHDLHFRTLRFHIWAAAGVVCLVEVASRLFL